MTLAKDYIYTPCTAAQGSYENQMEEIKRKMRLNRDIFGKIKGSTESHPSLGRRKSTAIK